MSPHHAFGTVTITRLSATIHVQAGGVGVKGCSKQGSALGVPAALFSHSLAGRREKSEDFLCKTPAGLWTLRAALSSNYLAVRFEILYFTDSSKAAFIKCSGSRNDIY